VTAASGTTRKKAPRQPMILAEEAAQRRRDHGGQRVAAVEQTASARGTCSSGTRRMTVAADIDQKPPMTTPISARPP
jgi:hypothetical protein